MSPVFF